MPIYFNLLDSIKQFTLSLMKTLTYIIPHETLKRSIPLTQ